MYHIQGFNYSGVSVKNIKTLSDRELAQSAREIAKETAERANRKAAATAILAVLRRHKLKPADLEKLDLGSPRKGQLTPKAQRKKGRPAKAQKSKTAPKISKANDGRAKVVSKYKNPKGAEKWTGRGRAPQWVSDILAKKRISIAQFKADKRYKI